MFFIIGKLSAQQDPSYIFYRYNMNYVNPAYAGAGETTEFGVNVRSQWAGVSGAPETQSFLASKYLGKKVGLGVSIVNDKTFIETQTSIGIDFSYRVQWDNYSYIYLGLKASGSSYNANTDGLMTFGLQSDSSLMNLDGGISPNVGVGIYFQNRKLAISFSVPKILKPSRLEEDGGIARLGRNRIHMYLMGSYDVELNEKLTFKPSTMIRYIENAPMSVDFTAALRYKKIFEFGTAYRLNEGLAGFILFDFGNSLNVGYAYEAPLSSALNNSNNGTHEILLKLKL